MIRVAASVLMVLAVGGFAYGVMLLLIPEGPKISPALDPYVSGVDERTAFRAVSLAQTPLAQRAVDVTARVAGRWKVLAAAERLLERADVPLRPAEALFFHVTGAFTVTLLVLSVWPSPLPVLASLVLTALGPVVVLNAAVRRRRQAFTAQLPDALRMLAGSLRSGRSLLQGVQAVAAEAEDPVGEELRRVLAQVRLGRPIDDALDEVSERVDSPDWQFAVTAVRIQRQVGGNLADLLNRVADTMVERQRLRGEVKALTAEGRVSAVVLGMLPVGLGLVMYTVDRAYISLLFHDPLGRAMLGGAAVVACVGFLWMKKTVDIGV